MTKKTLFILKLKVSEALYDYRLTTSIKTNISNLYMFLKAENFEFYTHILTKKYRTKEKGNILPLIMNLTYSNICDFSFKMGLMTRNSIHVNFKRYNESYKLL